MDVTWHSLHEQACRPYRQAGRFAWHFARGKLGRDPVFRGILERGLLPERAHVLDLGCGQGLLASLLATIDEHVRHRRPWPEAWGRAPAHTRYTGVELMPRDVERAQRALASANPDAAFICGDIQKVALPDCDVVVILDVLHYFPHAGQVAVLQSIRQALSPRGRLLLRVGDAADRRRFRISQWVDRAAAWSRGHQVAPTFCRTLDDWRQLLQGLGFSLTSLPMSQGTPFANVLLVADLGRPAGDHA
ncbi:class I SAM-dependent methyltransferase [Ideonella sp. DXS29W]|uniref:Class I SAM-dependent methyltransferase n=1 Tax=Ideonella lacteola TaxID=2984193 RepID=A0ABU9BNI5_9BURK